MRELIEAKADPWSRVVFDGEDVVGKNSPALLLLLSTFDFDKVLAESDADKFMSDLRKTGLAVIEAAASKATLPPPPPQAIFITRSINLRLITPLAKGQSPSGASRPEGRKMRLYATLGHWPSMGQWSTPLLVGR